MEVRVMACNFYQYCSWFYCFAFGFKCTHWVLSRNDIGGGGGGDFFFVCKQQKRIIMDVENEMLSLLSLFIYNILPYSQMQRELFSCVHVSDGSIKDEKMIVKAKRGICINERSEVGGRRERERIMEH